MNIFRYAILAAVLVQAGFPANLSISTYFKDGFTPAAIGSDAQGNIYVAGSAIVDQSSRTTGAVVAKLDPQATQYLYLQYLDSAASDQVSAMAVDSAGNAYIAGWTTNPNFPAFGGGALGTSTAGGGEGQSFVTKLNPQGVVMFSVLIGGASAATVQGIAVTPQGQILISGIASAKGFPTTAGAYSVADSTNHWFLMELDAAAGKTVFSATGIGGSSIALDAAGNIYLAGSSVGTDYPTTAGAYQTTFVQGFYCFGLCQVAFPGNLQHVTKVDPAGSKLIYSTGLNDITERAGSTTNTGLAVDAAGNAYVTGTLLQGLYPYTVTAPTDATSYLTKLDAAGANALFSVPVGGGGVQLDSSGRLYVGGTVVSITPFLPIPPAPPVALPSIFSGLPQVCEPNYVTAPSEAYAMKLDPASGTVQDAQWLDGAALGAAGITLAGGKVWIAGASAGPQVPFTPAALAPQNLGPGYLEGAYVSAVDFSAASTGPAIACVVDAGNLTHVGAVAPFQLLSIFGTGLGPETGVAAPDGSDTSVAGVSVMFDGQPAQVLYVSTSQINVAVPAPVLPPSASSLPSTTVMQLTVNGASIERQFPLTQSNLNIFADLSQAASCPNVPTTNNGFQPLAANADGSRNTCTNPAKYGSTVSLFVEGAGAFSAPPPAQLTNVQAMVGFCSAQVIDAKLINGFVYKVDISLPASLTPCDQVFNGTQGEPVSLSFNGAPVGPLYVPVNLVGPIPDFSLPVQPMLMIVWMTE